MSFLQKIFKKEIVKSNDDFWKWFKANEETFYKVVKKGSNIERDFFGKLSPKLNELREGYFYQAGMADDSNAELILTADGNITNMVFVEELVSAAPEIRNWKFTAHKPALDIKNVSISMDGYTFDRNNLFFYSNELTEYPDEIDITVVHTDMNESNKPEIIRGAYIFLDNFLGEVDFVTLIDNLTLLPEQKQKKN